MKKYSIIKRMTSRITVIGYCLLVIGMTSCSDMLETESDLVEFEENHTLNHATDSVYSVMGILNKMQVIADRVVVLGEVRGDLMLPTQAASTDLKRLSAFDFKEANSYNQVSDYYAVINNCNYYLAHVDTAMERRGRNLFLREYAVVKSYRAWTYLQLALAYGKVPLVLQPLMTEKEAREAMSQTPADIQTICETFINDLTPFVGVNLPDFGSINSMSSEDFFIPMRVLLGDLCLWAGRYQEAARWYHDYLTDRYDPIQMSHQLFVGIPGKAARDGTGEDQCVLRSDLIQLTDQCLHILFVVSIHEKEIRLLSVDRRIFPVVDAVCIHHDVAFPGLPEDLCKAHDFAETGFNDILQDAARSDRRKLIHISHHDQPGPDCDSVQQSIHQERIHHGHFIHNDHVCLQRIGSILSKGSISSIRTAAHLQKAVYGLRLVSGGCRHALCSAAGRCCQCDLQSFLFKE